MLSFSKPQSQKHIISSCRRQRIFTIQQVKFELQYQKFCQNTNNISPKTTKAKLSIIYASNLSKYRPEIEGLKIVSSPAQPFAVHIWSFSSNVRFKGSLQYRRPVQVTFIIGYIVSPIIRICMGVGSSPCSPFATRKFRSQVRPIPGRIERLPPLT